MFDAVFTNLEAHNDNQVRMFVTMSNGDEASVIIDLFDHYVRFSIIPNGDEQTDTDEEESTISGTNDQKAFYTIDARTASLDPVYGLGDYGSHANEFTDVYAPCGFHVGARDAANVMGLVRDENTYDLISREKKQYQWMLGPSMLATPLFGTDFETAVSRDVYLPEGVWIDYESGKRFYGPTTLEAYSLPENKIPIFIGGKGVVVSKANQKSENVNVEIFPIAKVGSQYTYTYIDGETTSTVINNNDGWNPETMVIANTTIVEMVNFEYDDTFGSFTFALTPGNNYELRGGE